jgi:hypothetical protein
MTIRALPDAPKAWIRYGAQRSQTRANDRGPNAPEIGSATVAIDPGVFRGVLPLPFSVLKGVGPLLVNPLTRGRAITLTFDQFKYGWVNASTRRRRRSCTTASTLPAPGC